MGALPQCPRCQRPVAVPHVPEEIRNLGEVVPVEVLTQRDVGVDRVEAEVAGDPALLESQEREHGLGRPGGAQQVAGIGLGRDDRDLFPNGLSKRERLGGVVPDGAGAVCIDEAERVTGQFGIDFDATAAPFQEEGKVPRDREAFGRALLDRVNAGLEEKKKSCDSLSEQHPGEYPLFEFFERKTRLTVCRSLYIQKLRSRQGIGPAPIANFGCFII